jgi:5-methylcytosine-specific restriction endonuclease McrA
VAAAKPWVNLTCKHCLKVFAVQPWAAKTGRKKFCSKACFFAGRELKGLFQTGHKDLVPPEKRGHSEETKRKISEKQRTNYLVGEAHWNWRGGKRTERKQAMALYPYRDWRNAVFRKDNWTCQVCNIRGGYLEADHIKPWCVFPELRYEIDNGRTVCKPCHVKLDTHGPKALKYLEIRNG